VIEVGVSVFEVLFLFVSLFFALFRFPLLPLSML